MRHLDGRKHRNNDLFKGVVDKLTDATFSRTAEQVSQRTYLFSNKVVVFFFLSSLSLVTCILIFFPTWTGCHVYSNMIGLTAVGLHTCVLARRLRASVQWSPSRLPPGDGCLDSGGGRAGCHVGSVPCRLCRRRAHTRQSERPPKSSLFDWRERSVASSGTVRFLGPGTVVSGVPWHEYK